MDSPDHQRRRPTPPKDRPPQPPLSPQRSPHPPPAPPPTRSPPPPPPNRSPQLPVWLKLSKRCPPSARACCSRSAQDVSPDALCQPLDVRCCHPLPLFRYTLPLSSA